MIFGRSAAEQARIQTLLHGFGNEEQESPAQQDIGTELNSSFLVRYLGSGLTPQQLRTRMLRSTVLSAALLAVLLFIAPPMLWPLAALPLLVEHLSLTRKEVARTLAFERDYPALLVSLASAIRTGLDPLVALRTASELFAKDSLVRAEVEALSVRLERGAAEDAAIGAFAATVRHPDVALFRTALVLARQQGASLGECLQRLARVTRHRQSFRRRMRAALAMQKLSAIGIGGCAVVLLLMQFISNPTAIKEALAHPVGSWALGGGFILVLFGLSWMLRISRPKV